MKENSIVFYRVFDRLYDEQSYWSLYIDFSNIVTTPIVFRLKYINYGYPSCRYSRYIHLNTYKKLTKGSVVSHIYCYIWRYYIDSQIEFSSQSFITDSIELCPNELIFPVNWMSMIRPSSIEDANNLVLLNEVLKCLGIRIE